ncbi:MAG TPA: DoxX family protein [Thermoanaerobaculia bacterium]|nr:DoxX family protein [Thermoanaerobaculia bacterium]
MTQTLTKRERVIYWLATGAVCAVMVFSAINFNLKEPLGPMKGAFKHLGYPDYFRIELTIAKALGVLALLIPIVPIKVKEFAYAGFAITLASASIAHFSVGDPALFVIDPLFFLTALIVSYVGFQKMTRSGSEPQPAERQSNHGGERLAAAQVRQSA